MGEARTPTRREAPANAPGRAGDGTSPAPGGPLPRPADAATGARLRLSRLRSAAHRVAAPGAPPR